MKGKTWWKWNSVILALSLMFSLFIGVSFTPTTHAAAGTFSEYYYGSNFWFKVYVPSSYQSGTSVPLMVMLHGCLQDPDDFAAGTRMNDLAEEKGFLVLYPEMNVYSNPNMCWNWFYDYNQHRASGEPAIIKGMVDQVKGAYAIDNNKVYVAGLSAGAAMATIMGATYPDVFHGVGVAAGVEYNAANTAGGGITAMSYGGPSPDSTGYDAYYEMGSNKRRMPVIVFHGTSDSAVAPINATQVVGQWAQTNDYIDDGSNNDSMNATADSTTSGTVTGGRSYTHYVYKDQNGSGLIEYYKVSGMEHAWSGGSSNGSYTDPYGPDATRIMWNFFTSH
ncbi:MAG TPA: PHB depolymerase family esterase [Bacilli bacterium]|nr:PHB depolymerase family esterase [Bacilli bacterium]